jgi:hypothetical protein
LGEYGGTFVAFFLLIQLTFVLAYIQLGTTHLPILDTIICVIPSAAFAFYGVLSSPSSAYSSVPAIIVGFVIVLYFWALKPQRIDAKTKLIFLTVLAAFYGLTVVIVSLSPVHAPIYTGPLVIFVLGVTLISGLLVVILQYPRTVLCYSLIWLAMGAFGKQYSAVPIQDNQKGRDISGALTAWLQERADALKKYRGAERPFPLIIMSAEGGGIYAAAHSFLGYRALTDYCPQLRMHTFAAIGVSGGGIGFLMERALRSGKHDHPTVWSCDISSKPLSENLPAIVGDLLSPVLANLLLRQPLGWLLPIQNTLADGGSALVGALSYYLAQSGGQLSATTQDAALMFVTTNVRSGSRVVFSQIRFGNSRDVETIPTGEFQPAGVMEPSSQTVMHAAVTSARFPFLTQSAVLERNSGLSTVLVDGGYADNTGALTASNLIASLKSVREILWGRDGCAELEITYASRFTEGVKWRECEVRLFLAHVAFAAESAEKQDERPAQPALLFDPVLALLGVRERESRRALVGLEELQRSPGINATSHVDNGFYAHLIAHRELALPLGWRLSPSRVKELYSDIAPVQSCDVTISEWRRVGAVQSALNRACYLMKAALFRRSFDKTFAEEQAAACEFLCTSSILGKKGARL